MPPSTASPSIHCGDCQRFLVLPDDADSPLLLRSVRFFIDEHAECVFNMTISVPLQRTPEGSGHGSR